MYHSKLIPRTPVEQEAIVQLIDDAERVGRD
jgi:hypothetical protein